MIRTLTHTACANVGNLDRPETRQQPPVSALLVRLDAESHLRAVREAGNAVGISRVAHGVSARAQTGLGVPALACNFPRSRYISLYADVQIGKADTCAQSSARRRGTPGPDPVYDNRRRGNERIYEANVISVRAVVGTPEQCCWVDREQLPPLDTTSTFSALFSVP